MRILTTAVLAATLAVAGLSITRAEAANRCVVAVGSADMITRDLAEFMAKAALKNSIAGMNAKPAGPIKLTCGPGVPVHCLARQRACK